MSKSAIRLSMLAIGATALVALPIVVPAGAASGGKQHRHHWNTPIHNHRFADQRPVARPAGPVCPGLARSFDCKIWPPPFDEDPDRKVSGTDGG